MWNHELITGYELLNKKLYRVKFFFWRAIITINGSRINSNSSTSSAFIHSLMAVGFSSDLPSLPILSRADPILYRQLLWYRRFMSSGVFTSFALMFGASILTSCESTCPHSQPSFFYLSLILLRWPNFLTSDQSSNI